MGPLGHHLGALGTRSSERTRAAREEMVADVIETIVLKPAAGAIPSTSSSSSSYNPDLPP